MKNLILIGGGGHCESCIDVIEQENKYQIVGILDKEEKLGSKVLGYSIVGNDADIPRYVKEDCSFLITLGQIKTPDIRIKLFNELKSLNAKLPAIISPLAYISKHATVGQGTIIMHKAIVNANAQIGNNCIINTNALIEHDVHVGSNCHISTSSVLNGGVTVGNNSFVGSNATVVQGVRLNDNSFVKAGCLQK